MRGAVRFIFVALWGSAGVHAGLVLVVPADRPVWRLAFAGAAVISILLAIAVQRTASIASLRITAAWLTALVVGYALTHIGFTPSVPDGYGADGLVVAGVTLLAQLAGLRGALMLQQAAPEPRRVLIASARPPIGIALTVAVFGVLFALSGDIAPGHSMGGMGSMDGMS